MNKTAIRTLRRLGGAGAMTAAVTAVGVMLTVAPASAVPNDAALARQGTAQYHNSSVITGDSNWFQLYDANNITCIDDPAGGMGIHFVNGARLHDPREIASQPEAVIYEPQKNGQLRLVAVEYVVFKADWEAYTHSTQRPRLFGQDFELTLAGNRYGLPDFYELHAWIWKNNPRGMNDDWNPNVTCQYA